MSFAWNGRDISQEKPNVEKLNDSSSIEWAISHNFTQLQADVMKLMTLFKTMDIQYINKLRRGEYKQWSDLIPELIEMSNKVDKIIDKIYDKMP